MSEQIVMLMTCHPTDLAIPSFPTRPGAAPSNSPSTGLSFEILQVRPVIPQNSVRGSGRSARGRAQTYKLNLKIKGHRPLVGGDVVAVVAVPLGVGPKQRCPRFGDW